MIEQDSFFVPLRTLIPVGEPLQPTGAMASLVRATGHLRCLLNTVMIESTSRARRRH